MSTLHGKVMLTIERREDWDDVRAYDTTASIQTCSNPNCYARDSVQEDFWCITNEELPGQVRRMEVGDVMRISARYTVRHTRYDGPDGTEFDSEITLDKCRVRRHQRPKMRYIPKSDRAALAAWDLKYRQRG